MSWANRIKRLDRRVQKAFGMPAVYSVRETGSSFPVEVNLRKDTVESDNGDGGTVLTDVIEAVFDRSGIAEVMRGDTFECEGVKYVIEHETETTATTTAAYVNRA